MLHGPSWRCLPTRLAGTLIKRGCTSVTCEPFFIYRSWPTEGHDMHASPEPLCAGQRGPEPRVTWWLPSSLAGLGAPTPTRAERQGSRGAGHVAVPEPSHLGSRGPELWGSWWCVDAHPALGPNLQLIRGGTQSVGYRQCWRSHKIMFVQHKQFIVNMFNQ
jgi:hypothetical protein